MKRLEIHKYGAVDSVQFTEPAVPVPNKDLPTVRNLLEAGTIKPIIDKTYPFDRVREALAHYHSGKARGKIVVSI